MAIINTDNKLNESPVSSFSIYINIPIYPEYLGTFLRFSQVCCPWISSCVMVHMYYYMYIYFILWRWFVEPSHCHFFFERPIIWFCNSAFSQLFNRALFTPMEVKQFSFDFYLFINIFCLFTYLFFNWGQATLVSAPSYM